MVVAGRQTAGRGRLGRSWESPASLGLYLSIVLRPAGSLNVVGHYPIAAAVAVCTACRKFAGDRIVLKWPNDVLAHGRKVAGVLAELRQGSAGAELVLGVGINVNHAGEDFPAGLRKTATSLRLLRSGAAVDRHLIAAALLESLATAIVRIRGAGWPEVAEQFLRYAPDATGRRVRLASGEEGLTAGLDASGALRVATANGVVLVHASESVALA